MNRFKTIVIFNYKNNCINEKNENYSRFSTAKFKN